MATIMAENKEIIHDERSEKKKKDRSDSLIDETGKKKRKKDRSSSLKKKVSHENEGEKDLKSTKEEKKMRKFDRIRIETLLKMRRENASEEDVYQEMFAEDFDDKIEELVCEYKNLKRTLKIRINSLEYKLLPEAQVRIQNDWLKVHIREWIFKIESLETKFEIVKRAHANAIEAFEKAQVLFTDKVELETTREALRNKKNDLLEANQLIQELQKVAWTMLPQKVARNCERIEKAMIFTRARLDELMYESYRLKMVAVSDRKEYTALQSAIGGEVELALIVDKKISNMKLEHESLKKKKQSLDAILNNGNNLLESRGITYEAAIATALSPLGQMIQRINSKEVKQVEEVVQIKDKKKKIKEVSLSESEIESPLEERERVKSIVAMDEKMNFLIEKLKEIDVELLSTRKEIEETNKEQKTQLIELKKIEDAQKEIQKIVQIKETIGMQLQQEIVLRKTYYNQIEDLKGKIRVFSRCRPISKSELARGNLQCVQFPDKYTVSVYGVSKDGKPKEFQFDRVFPPETQQDDVFEDTSRLIQSAFDGFNVCIFAYGQTGSGKTHTLIGNLQDAPGIAPRSFVRLFEIVNEGKVKFKAKLFCYMLELYNEKLLDLMAQNAEYSDKLEIKKDQHGMVIVPGAELLLANSGEELKDLFLKGNGNRHIASTKMNSESSRSHLIISVMIECTQLANGKIIRGKMSIIDLAGSERQAKSGVKGVGATEATAINMSLSALGDVISALTSGQPFVPYRNNKLTLLMQDSLGGNAKTLMFVNLSPVDYNATETCNSLVYAQRVKLIKNDAIKVADTEELPKLQLIINRLLSGEAIETFVGT